MVSGSGARPEVRGDRQADVHAADQVVGDAVARLLLVVHPFYEFKKKFRTKIYFYALYKNLELRTKNSGQTFIFYPLYKNL
jgi:hypothetical protein